MARPIFETLRHLRGGVFLDDAAEQLADLVQAVDSTGKGGKITLEISIKKATRGGAMVLTDKIKVTKPVEQPFETMMFGTPEGNLMVDNPAQAKLDLTAVATTKELTSADLKQVAA